MNGAGRGVWLIALLLLSVCAVCFGAVQPAAAIDQRIHQCGHRGSRQARRHSRATLCERVLQAVGEQCLCRRLQSGWCLSGGAPRRGELNADYLVNAREHQSHGRAPLQETSSRSPTTPIRKPWTATATFSIHSTRRSCSRTLATRASKSSTQTAIRRIRTLSSWGPMIRSGTRALQPRCASIDLAPSPAHPRRRRLQVPSPNPPALRRPIVIDVSGLMGDSFQGQRKIDKAKDAAKTLVQYVEDRSKLMSRGQALGDGVHNRRAPAAEHDRRLRESAHRDRPSAAEGHQPCRRHRGRPQVSIRRSRRNRRR